MLIVRWLLKSLVTMTSSFTTGMPPVACREILAKAKISMPQTVVWAPYNEQQAQILVIHRPLRFFWHAVGPRPSEFYCIVLYSIVLYCMVLYGVVWCCIVLDGESKDSLCVVMFGERSPNIMYSDVWWALTKHHYTQWILWFWGSESTDSLWDRKSVV